MGAPEPHAQSHAEECGDEDEVSEVGGDADLRAEPADERQLEDQDRESGRCKLDGGAAAPAAVESVFCHRRHSTDPPNSARISGMISP
jgi:hypothetical protein